MIPEYTPIPTFTPVPHPIYNDTNIFENIVTVFSQSDFSVEAMMNTVIRNSLGPFSDLLMILVSLFIFSIGYIRTKDPGAIIFLLAVFAGIFNPFVTGEMMKVISTVMILALTAILWKVLGKRLSVD